MYLLGYNYFMYLIKQTNIFSKWLTKLKDTKGKVSILRRIERMKVGGDKSSQSNDIKKANEILKELDNE